ncbi:MAG: DsbC family protein [Burkholderiales bacterium]|nr:DsbC family protein [Burkholderiales bacterium]
MVFRMLSLVCGAALLCAACMADANENAVRKAFAAKFPDMPVQSVTRLPYLGLYEIVVGEDGDILYADEKVEYLVDGNIISTAKMSNLTSERKRKLSSVPFDDLPLDLAFKRVKGKGERKMAVFSDPDCPWCRKLEGELAKLDNVTIYMFLYPIESLHPGAPEISKKIWCSPDRLKAWDDYMNRKVVPMADANCPNPVDKLVDYGRKKRVNGTPALVFANGERVGGYIPAAEIEKRLSGRKED